jgi:hypothetical protein
MELVPPDYVLLHAARHDDGSREYLSRPGAPSLDVAEASVATADYGCGRGLFARRDVAAGGLVLSEAPLLVWSGHASMTEVAVRVAVSALDAESRAAVFALHQLPAYGWQKSEYGLFESNAFRIADEPLPTTAIFNLCSVANHSCAPNAHFVWDHPTHRMTCLALADIQRGQEVIVSCTCPSLSRTMPSRTALCTRRRPVRLLMCRACAVRTDLDAEALRAPRTRRQEALTASFGFLCVCARCGLRGESLERSDARQRRISALGSRIEDAAAAAYDRAYDDARAGVAARGEGARRPLALVEERLALLDEESMLGEAWDVYARAADECRVHGDASGDRTWSQRIESEKPTQSLRRAAQGRRESASRNGRILSPKRESVCTF